MSDIRIDTSIAACTKSYAQETCETFIHYKTKYNENMLNYRPKCQYKMQHLTACCP